MERKPEDISFYSPGERLFLLYDFLLKNTNRKYVVKPKQINDFLNEHGIYIEKKAIYADFEKLRSATGLEIVWNAHKQGYQILNPPFEPYELRLMVDSIQSSKFITQTEARKISQKITALADIHTRERSKARLIKAGAQQVLTLADLLNAPVDGSGYNEQYGLLGSNKSTEESVKLFPRDCMKFVESLSAEMSSRTGKNIEVMIYGDGAFKDPVGKIWELADPVVSPAYTAGLGGTPNELKLKYLADNDFAGLSGEELRKAVSESIKSKKDDLVGNMASQGTTPRNLTDLIGSLCDLTSGSGDKGTPVVFIKGYFDNYSMD